MTALNRGMEMTLEQISERGKGGASVRSWVKGRSTSWHVLNGKGPRMTQTCRWGSHGRREADQGGPSSTLRGPVITLPEKETP